ncbi:hypothetical protein [Salmonella enterica]|nr:hypothetical protein [Salmonella enterica]WKN79891.1 hypothetical protein PQC30_10375 [Salmonella enterica subsp. diarizonae]
MPAAPVRTVVFMSGAALFCHVAGICQRGRACSGYSAMYGLEQ